MVSDAIAVMIVGAILVLPWTLRQAGLFDKVKRWYKVLVAGLLVGLLSLILGASATTTILGQETTFQITLVIETASLILVVISTLGIIKSLLVE